MKSIKCTSSISLWHSKLGLKTLVKGSLWERKWCTKYSRSEESSNDESWKLGTDTKTQKYLNRLLRVLVWTTTFASRVESIQWIISSDNLLNLFSFFTLSLFLFFFCSFAEFKVSLLLSVMFPMLMISKCIINQVTHWITIKNSFVIFLQHYICFICNIYSCSLPMFEVTLCIKLKRV